VVHKPSTLEKVGEENEQDSEELQKSRSAKARSGTARAKGSGGVQDKRGASKQPGSPKTPTGAARRTRNSTKEVDDQPGGQSGSRQQQMSKGQAAKRKTADKAGPKAGQSKQGKARASGSGGRQAKRART
jgi:hypothetical protein